MEGRDLTPLLEGRSAGPVPSAYLESFYPLESFGWSPLRGLRDGDWKLIVGAAVELYDLENDPGEEHDLAGEDLQRAERMKRQLQEYRDRESAAAGGLEPDEATLEAIRSLGYVGSSVSAAEIAVEPEIDPRHHIRSLPKITSAADRFDRGFVEEALDDLRRAGEADPGNPWVHELSVQLLRSAGRASEADRLCLEFLARAEVKGSLPGLCADSEPSPPQSGDRPVADLSSLMLDAERLAARRKGTAVQRVLTQITRLLADGAQEPLPKNERMRLAETANRIGGLCWDSAEHANAAHAYSLALAWMPGDARLHYNLGLAWERIGLLEKALDAHRRALQLDPSFSSAAKHRDLISAELERWRH